MRDTAMYEAIRHDPTNRDLVLKATSEERYSLLHATKPLKGDRELALAAVRHCGDNLLLTSLEDDKEVVLQAVLQLGDSLRYAAKRFTGDKEVVMAAISQDGMSLRYASDELKDDEEVVMAAVQKQGRALRHASKRLRASLVVVMEALKQNQTAYAYIVVEDHETVYGISPDQRLCQQPLDDMTTKTGWSVLSKSGVKTFTITGPHVYAVCSDGWIYKQTLVLITPDSDWLGPLSGERKMRSIVVSAGFIYGVGEEDKRVYKQVLSQMRPSSKWDGPVSTDELELAFICVIDETVYGVGLDGKLYRQMLRNLSNFSQWDGPVTTPALDLKAVGHFRNKIYGVSTDNKLHWQIYQDLSPQSSWVLGAGGTISAVCVCNTDLKEACSDMLESSWKEHGAHLDRRKAAAAAQSSHGW